MTSVQVFFSTLKKVSANGIWLLTLILGADFLHVPDIFIKYLSVALKAYLAISLGLMIKLLSVMINTLLVLKTDHLTDLQRQRRFTIIPLFKSILKCVTYFAGAVLVLHLVGINPAPILAGAGIVGLAVGFGAQNLINDIVCGFFNSV